MLLRIVNHKYCALFLCWVSLLIACGGGGGGSSGDGGGNGGSPDVTQIIGPEGGRIELPSGARIDIPAGALDITEEISFSSATIPSNLPDRIVAVSAFIVEPDGLVFNIPVTITCPIPEDLSQESGAIGIYRFDGQQWSYVGGNKDAGKVSAEIRGFSSFVLGGAPMTHKRVQFNNTGLDDVVVRVYEYSLADPDLGVDVDTSAVAWVAPLYPARMLLPLGSYSFCVDWDQGTGNRKHKILGSLPENPIVTLVENTNFLAPPIVAVGSTDIGSAVGRCPDPVLRAASGFEDREIALSPDQPMVRIVPDDFVVDFGRLDEKRKQSPLTFEPLRPLPDAVPCTGSRGAPEITPPSTLPVSPFEDYPSERYRNLCQYVNMLGENGFLDQTYLRTLITCNDSTEYPSDHCLPLENNVHNHDTHVNPEQHPCGMTCVFAIVADVNGDELTGGFEFPTTLYGHGNYYAAIHVPDANSGGSIITLPDGRSVANILPNGLVPGSIIDTQEKLDAYNATLLYLANAGALPVQTNSALVFPDEELLHEKLQTSDLYLITFGGGGPTAIKADVTLDQGKEGIDFDGDGELDDGVPGDIIVGGGGGLGRVHKVTLVDGDWKDNSAAGYLWLTGVTGTFTPGTGLFVDGMQRATVTAVGQALPIIWEAPDDPDTGKTTHDRRHNGDRIPAGGTVQLEARISDGDTEEQIDFHWVSYPDSLATIDVEKTANPTRVKSGEQVTYTVTITNTSAEETVTITQVFDVVVAGDISEFCSPRIPARLDPNESVTCTVRATVTGEPDTYIKNIAVVWGYDDDGNPLGGDDTAEVIIKEDDDCALDVDRDGHYAEGSCGSPADDCNDNDSTIYPGAVEICNDGIDNDCDDDIDCDDSNCAYYDACSAVVEYAVWIHEDSRTCCAGDFGGVAPYQFHGTEEQEVDAGAIILATFDSQEDMTDWTCDRVVHIAYNWIRNWAEIGGYIVTNLPCEANAPFQP